MIILNTVQNRFNEIKNWLEEYERYNENHVILDAGAGPQRYKQIFKKNNYISQDFGKYMGGGNTQYHYEKNETLWKGNLCDIISDISEIPLENNSIDVIICTEVFEHIYSPEAALIEFKRLLKKNGQIILTMPYGCHYHQEPYFYNAGLSHHYFEKFSRDHGFKILNCSLEGDFRSFMQWENQVLGLMQTNILYRSLFKIWGLTSRIFYRCFKFCNIKQPKFHTGIFIVMEK
jgi:SAM-dependent methyltransferase